MIIIVVVILVVTSKVAIWDFLQSPCCTVKCLLDVCSLTDEGGEETRVPRKHPNDKLQKILHTKARKFKPQLRLCTGHNRLNSHMHSKLKLASSPTCPCGQEDQTTERVLQRCPLHKATREDVWPVNTPLTTKLYSCKQELEKMVSFISRVALIV